MKIKKAKELLRNRQAGILWTNEDGKDICYGIVTNGSEMFYGKAVRSHRDTMNRSLARAIAIGRAINKAKQNSVDLKNIDEDRENYFYKIARTLNPIFVDIPKKA